MKIIFIACLALVGAASSLANPIEDSLKDENWSSAHLHKHLYVEIDADRDVPLEQAVQDITPDMTNHFTSMEEEKKVPCLPKPGKITHASHFLPHLVQTVQNNGDIVKKFKKMSALVSMRSTRRNSGINEIDTALTGYVSALKGPIYSYRNLYGIMNAYDDLIDKLQQWIAQTEISGTNLGRVPAAKLLKRAALTSFRSLIQPFECTYEALTKKVECEVDTNSPPPDGLVDSHNLPLFVSKLKRIIKRILSPTNLGFELFNDMTFVVVCDVSMVILADPDCPKIDETMSTAVERYVPATRDGMTIEIYDSEVDELTTALTDGIMEFVGTQPDDFSTKGKGKHTNLAGKILALSPWPVSNAPVPESINTTRRGDSNTLRSHPTAIGNWKQADEIIHQLIEDGEELSPGVLRQINGELNNLGKANKFRNAAVAAGGFRTIDRVYIHHTQIKTEVLKLLTWLHDRLADLDDSDPSHFISCIEIANDAYAWLVSIHSFNDGNGRTSKLIGDYVLMKCGLPPIAWSGEYALFGAQLLKGAQKPADWKEITLVKTMGLVLDGVKRWKKKVKG